MGGPLDQLLGEVVQLFQRLRLLSLVLLLQRTVDTHTHTEREGGGQLLQDLTVGWAHAAAGVPEGVDDGSVARAAAQVAVDRLLELVERRGGELLQRAVNRHHEAGRAEATVV